MVPGRSSVIAGLPNVSELVDMVYEYCGSEACIRMRSLIRGNQTRTMAGYQPVSEHAGQCAY